MPNIDSNAFENLMKDALIERGLNWEAANSIVSSLIQTSLRGVDSHGINLFPHYYQELILNKINKNTNIIINQTSNTTCIIDANNVFGHYVGDQAVKKTIEMCSHSGIAAVSVKNSNHFGAVLHILQIRLQIWGILVLLLQTVKHMSMHTTLMNCFLEQILFVFLLL